MYPITLDGISVEAKRKEIKAYFNNTYDLFEKVFDLLREESVFYKKSEPTRHPMIFYYGHTATFFVNKLLVMKIIKERINPHFESIFAVGVDEMDWDDLEESRYAWPRVAEVKAYRDSVRRMVNGLIESLEFSLPIRDDSAMWIILMAIEHERIHIETSLVLHRQMPIEDVKAVEDFVLCPHAAKALKNEMVRIEGGEIRLGKSKEHHLYGWDNEYGEYVEEIGDFEASRYLVSNGEFMEFVLDGGYERSEFWSDEGRLFLERSGAKYPHFWVKNGDLFQYRALYEIIDMPMNWPVDVNALEAEAFCRYKSSKEAKEYRLPSEAEYRAIYKHSGLQDVEFVDESRANYNFYYYASSSPVDMFEFNGVYDVVGNVWQWSRSTIFGFKGFEVHPAYDDFSTPTFDDKHALIFGSSWASSGNLIMKHSRYAFRRHFFQNAGFRYILSGNEDRVEDIYESDDVVSRYCEFQYTKNYLGGENFALYCAKIAASFAIKRTKALDLGCLTGRASFELAKEFESVEGVDFSVRFIGVGSKLKNEGYITFLIDEAGGKRVQKRVTLRELGYEDIAKRVEFWQGDANNLKPNLEGYDLIMLTSIMESLTNLESLLESVTQRINRDGILVVSSKEFIADDFEDLKKILRAQFELLHTEEIPYALREYTQQYKREVARLSVWRKK